MKQQPPLSDEEIRSYMDFDRLMANRKLAMNKPKFHHLKWLVPAIAVVGISIWLIYKPAEMSNLPESEDQGRKVTESTQDVAQSPSPEVNETVVTPLEAKPSEAQPKLNNTLQPAEKEKALDEPVEKKQPEDVYVQAEPVDGYSALYAYFNSNLVYPPQAVKDSIQGVETVSFIINTDGKPERVTIKQSLGEPFEKEARRLIENMPQWKPATLNGKPVPSQMSVPLTFQIQKVNVNR